MVILFAASHSKIMNSSICVNQIRRIGQSSLERLKLISSQGLNWRANENDPRKHTPDHEGLFYELPPVQEIQQIFGHTSPFDLETTRYYKTLGLMPLMIRKPALTAIDYLKRIDYSTPNIRMLFYGDKGTGKTHTLAHLLHYLHLNQEHLIIHVREMKKFTRSPRDIAESTSRPGRIDTPLDAAILLQQFRVQNEKLLDKTKETLVCSQDYKWSLREVTKAGEPVVNIADHGVNRVVHASDCIAALFKELMLAAHAGTIKLVSILDNVTWLFYEEAGVRRHKDHKKMLVDEITVARAIKKLIRGQYKGGIVLATCDDKLSNQLNQTPREVLGIDGWNHFDPFLPIATTKYSRKEFESCMNMYQDIGWLCRPESCSEEARDEVRFVSGLHPKEVEYLCQEM